MIFFIFSLKGGRMAAWAVAIGVVVSGATTALMVLMITYNSSSWCMSLNNITKWNSFKWKLLLLFPWGLGQAAWNYYDNQKNNSESFSLAEQESWNAQKKKKTDASTPPASGSGSNNWWRWILSSPKWNKALSQWEWRRKGGIYIGKERMRSVDAAQQSKYCDSR